MKNIVLAATISMAAFFAGCKGTQVGSVTDDVYTNPAEERKAREVARQEQARKDAAEKMERDRAEAERVAAESNNTYYKDPSYNADDYYDYEYSARINRFHRPVYGAAYYDPYYTNMYTYNQNPSMWGMSIYSGWGMPSTMFAGYSMGISTGWGYGYGMNSGCLGCYPGMGMYGMYGSGMYGMGMYDPFWGPSYGMGFYNPWMMSPWYGYNAYNSGYMAGYHHGLATGGYYNRLDPNSGYGRVNVGPRSASGAGRIQSASGRYMQTVAEEQNNSPRFTPVENRNQSRGRINQRGPTESGRSATEPQQQSRQPVYQDRGNPQQPRGRSNSGGRIITQPDQGGRQRSNDSWNTPSNQGSNRGSNVDRPSQPRSGGGGRPRG